MSLKMTDYNAAYAEYRAALQAACDTWQLAKYATVTPPPQCPDSFPDFLSWCLANGYAASMDESFGQ